MCIRHSCSCSCRELPMSRTSSLRLSLLILHVDCSSLYTAKAIVNSMASGLGPFVSVVLFAFLGNRWEVRNSHWLVIAKCLHHLIISQHRYSQFKMSCFCCAFLTGSRICGQMATAGTTLCEVAGVLSSAAFESDLWHVFQACTCRYVLSAGLTFMIIPLTCVAGFNLPLCAVSRPRVHDHTPCNHVLLQR